MLLITGLRNLYLFFIAVVSFGFIIGLAADFAGIEQRRLRDWNVLSSRLVLLIGGGLGALISRCHTASFSP